MKQLDIIKHMDRAFSKRQLCNHAGQRGVIRCGSDEYTTAIVLDLAVSRQILVSHAFKSFNYFEEGYRHLANSRYSLETVGRFFQDGPLFLEGKEHRSCKQAFDDLLREQSNELTTLSPRIKDFMKKRKPRLRSALDFSRLFVEICLGTTMSNLLSTSLKTCLRALRARRNVFYFHFHPLRHRVANDALAMLEQGPDTSPCPTDRVKKLVCQSMIVMAYDPLVAIICANLVDGHTSDVGTSAGQYCPVSFVSRICVEPVVIGDESFEEGDVCYVSLVPAADEETRKTFPFGAGVHLCVGKKISLQILQLAEEIIATDFNEGFEKEPALSPDGAFLSFRD